MTVTLTEGRYIVNYPFIRYPFPVFRCHRELQFHVLLCAISVLVFLRPLLTITSKMQETGPTVLMHILAFIRLLNETLFQNYHNELMQTYKQS